MPFFVRPTTLYVVLQAVELGSAWLALPSPSLRSAAGGSRQRAEVGPRAISAGLAPGKRRTSTSTAPAAPRVGYE